MKRFFKRPFATKREMLHFLQTGQAKPKHLQPQMPIPKLDWKLEQDNGWKVVLDEPQSLDEVVQSQDRLRIQDQLELTGETSASKVLSSASEAVREEINASKVLPKESIRKGLRGEANSSKVLPRESTRGAVREETKTERKSETDNKREESKKGVLWFNDPHLLSKRITNVAIGNRHCVKTGTVEEKTQIILDLIKRHTGASNPEVFGNAMNHMNQLQQYQSTVDLYKLMNERKLKPTEAGYTSLLDALSKINGSMDVAKLAYQDMEKSVIHLNAMLHYLSFQGNDGVSYGMKIFKEFPAEHLDAISYSLLFKLTKSLKDRQHIPYLITVFKEAEKRNQIDNQVLSFFIANFCRPDVQDYSFVLDVIRRYFGLSKTTLVADTKEFRVINVFTFNYILILARKMGQPQLGLKWYNFVTKRLKLEPDQVILDQKEKLESRLGKTENDKEMFNRYNKFKTATVYTKTKMYNKAYNFHEKSGAELSPKSHYLMIRMNVEKKKLNRASDLLMKFKDVMFTYIEENLKSAQSQKQLPEGVRSLSLYVTCLQQYHKGSKDPTVVELINKYRQLHSCVTQLPLN